MSQVVDGLDRRVGYAAKRLQQALRTAGDRALRPGGLTMPQYAVLSVLAERPGLSNSELARRCFVTRQTMNGLLAGLVAAGLVARAAHPRDGRVLRTELTVPGREAVGRGTAAVGQVEERMTAGLTDLQQRQLLELLTACIDNLEPDVAAAMSDRAGWLDP